MNIIDVIRRYNSPKFMYLSQITMKNTRQEQEKISTLHAAWFSGSSSVKYAISCNILIVTTSYTKLV